MIGLKSTDLDTDKTIVQLSQDLAGRIARSLRLLSKQNPFDKTIQASLEELEREMQGKAGGRKQ